MSLEDSLCSTISDPADQRLCLATEAAQAAQTAAESAKNAAEVPEQLELYGMWGALISTGIGILLALLGLIVLATIAVYWRKVPKKISDVDWQKIALSAGGVSVTLEQFEEANKSTQAVAESLTEEMLGLTDFVDRLLIRNEYDNGGTFAPPSCESSKLSILKSIRDRNEQKPNQPEVGVLYWGPEELNSFGISDKQSISDVAYTDAVPCHPLAGNAAHNRTLYELSILWVDDRDDLVAFERAMIKRQGHRVCPQSDTEKARTRLKEQEFDLIITDTTRGEDETAWDAIYQSIRREDIERGLQPGERTPFVVFTRFERAEKVNEKLKNDTEAFATHSFAQMRWRIRWLERKKANT